jgi:predicted GTPase
MNLTATVSLYYVPYNGPTGIVRTYRRGRLINQYVQWYKDADFKTAEWDATVPLKASKDTLLRAVYWMGTSIADRSLERLKKEALREIYPNKIEHVRTELIDLGPDPAEVGL